MFSSDWNQAAESLIKGAVGVIPTDTVYGIVCSANNTEAVSRLYATKRRNDKPGTIIASSVEQLVQLGIKARYLKAVDSYWPGAISVIIPTGLSVPYISQGKGSIAMRVVAGPANLVSLLQSTGPLLTSSANQPGEKPAETIAQAQKYFNDSVDFYLDGGDLSGRAPSTIIRIIDDAIELVRDGAVHINEKGENLDNVDDYE